MVHIACVSVAHWPETLYHTLYHAATPQRQARAENCRRFQDACRCIASDALLRFALSETFGLQESHLLQRGQWGKPRIQGREDFHVSLSHSGRWAVIGWGESPLGVDVEQVARCRNWESLSRRFFTGEEQAFADSPLSFARVWTGKESYLKYLGTGLHKPLNSFCIFSLEERFHWEMPDDDHVLCLCSQEKAYDLRILTEAELLSLPPGLYRE